MIIFNDFDTQTKIHTIITDMLKTRSIEEVALLYDSGYHREIINCKSNEFPNLERYSVIKFMEIKHPHFPEMIQLGCSDRVFGKMIEIGYEPTKSELISFIKREQWDHVKIGYKYFKKYPETLIIQLWDNDQIDLIKWLDKKGYKDLIDFKLAIKHRSKKWLEYLDKEGYRCDSEEFIIGIRSGDQSVLDILKRDPLFLINDTMFIEATKVNDVETMKWLLNRVIISDKY
jgi:hypothetical protein